MYTNAIAVEHVSKSFAGHRAVRDLSLSVPRGGIFGLLGPNGAGKSTTIRMIMSIILPDSGTVTLFGGEKASRDLSTRIGYLPEERGLYRKMFVLDHLIYLGEIKGISRSKARQLATEWLARLGLSDWSKRRVEDLSKGMQQKVQFIGTLLHQPELVILDEPFSGLDPVNSKVMRDIVVEIARNGGTVLFSTHIMEQAEKMCDRVAIIARGEKVVDGKLADVKRVKDRLAKLARNDLPPLKAGLTKSEWFVKEAAGELRTFVVFDPGTFKWGSPLTEKLRHPEFDAPQQDWTIKARFALCNLEVTQKEVMAYLARD